MIIVRNTFQLKFGKAKEAIALIKEGQNIHDEQRFRKAQVYDRLNR